MRSETIERTGSIKVAEFRLQRTKWYVFYESELRK